MANKRRQKGYLAMVQLGGITRLYLRHDLTWDATGEQNLASIALRVARDATAREYGPSDGYPGLKAAREVASVFDGKLTLGDVPETPDGAIP